MDETDHRADDLETIVVDGEDIIEVMKRNYRDYEEQRHHVLRVMPPFEGEKRAEPFTDEPYTYYSTDMEVKPLHINPYVFLTGTSHPPRVPEELRHPDRGVQMTLFEDDDHADDFQEWWDTAVEEWESHVRDHFEDKTAILKYSEWGVRATEVEIRFDGD